MTQKKWLTVALAALLVGVYARPAVVQASDDSDEDFKLLEIRKGDTLSMLAAKYMWQIIHNMNKDLIKNPNLIYPGQVIKMPYGANLGSLEIARKRSYDADMFRVAFVENGDARFVGDDGSERTLRSGLEIQQFGQAEVQNGPMRVDLSNGTRVSLFDATTVMFTGTRKEGRETVRRLEVKSGRILVEIPSMEGARFVVETPAGNVQLDKGVHTIEVVEGEGTRVSVYGGTAQIQRKGQRLDISEKQGVRLQKDKRVPRSTITLPAPATKLSPEGVVGTTVKFDWKDVAGINRYVLRVASDVNFDNMLFDGDVYDASEFEMGIYNAGNYYWSVEAIDGDGFRSMDSSPMRINVVPDAKVER